MKYLITGGAGFIGSNFINYMLNIYDDIEIFIVDNLTYAGNLLNFHNIKNFAKCSFHKVDLCDKAAIDVIFNKNSPDYVINFAAESHVDRSIRNPDIFVRTNILGTHTLLDLSLNYGIKKFIQISTDEVYGSLGSSGYFTEDTPLNPHSPYSASKAAADLLVIAYHDTYKLPINITRCSNNYGPYQHPEKLIPMIILNSLYNKKIPVYGNGLNIRDWLHVEDHCTAIDAVINNGRIGEVYNIGGNNEWTNIDIVVLIIGELLKIMPDARISEELIEFVEDRKGHDQRYAIDSTKIKSELGWKPHIRFEEGIKETIKWYMNSNMWLNSWKDKGSIIRMGYL